MNREQIKQTLIDHGVSDIPGALLDALAQSPRSCCDAERAEQQSSTIRALEEAAIDLWEQSPEIAKINPWVRCEWSEISERSRIYWRGQALTSAIRSADHAD